MCSKRPLSPESRVVILLRSLEIVENPIAPVLVRGKVVEFDQ